MLPRMKTYDVVKVRNSKGSGYRWQIVVNGPRRRQELRPELYDAEAEARSEADRLNAIERAKGGAR
jgi:hypothetical protein